MPPRPILDTLRELWQSLESMQVPMALMGGLALSAWKHVRSTQDVDLLVGVGDHAEQEILACVQNRGFRARRTPAIADLGQLRVIQLLFEPADAFIDVKANLLLADSEYHTVALQRCKRRMLPDAGGSLDVLNCDDLILHKLLAGRIIDRVDAIALIQANRDELDREYLQAWADRLNVSGDLRDVWLEATSQELPR